MKKQKKFPRGQGILMPLFSLNGKYGIGTLGDEAVCFLNFLSRAGCNMWQLLPLGPTGYGNSPYQCFSAFAGNPYFLNPEWFFEKGWIDSALLSKFEASNTGRVDYGALCSNRKSLFGEIYEGFKKYATQNRKKDFEVFKSKQEYWLKDYTVFLALKEYFGGCGRADFPKFKTKSNAAVSFAEQNLKERIEYFSFLEYASAKASSNWLSWSFVRPPAFFRSSRTWTAFSLSPLVTCRAETCIVKANRFSSDNTAYCSASPSNFSATG